MCIRDRCNALNLALDLKMDRSNVSRILNQLFNELLLIKINGRPTIFISRDVLSEEFPYAKIPQIVPSLSALKEHLHPGSTDEYKASAKDFDIIGNLPREALKETVDTVSYTHLDVYKRQSLIFSGLSGYSLSKMGPIIEAIQPACSLW